MEVVGDNLAAMIRAGSTVWAAGAYDALSARLIEEAGFPAIMTTGFGVFPRLTWVNRILSFTRCPKISM